MFSRHVPENSPNNFELFYLIASICVCNQRRCVEVKCVHQDTVSCMWRSGREDALGDGGLDGVDDLSGDLVLEVVDVLLRAVHQLLRTVARLHTTIVGSSRRFFSISSTKKTSPTNAIYSIQLNPEL